MPCTDNRGNEENGVLKAALCGVLTAINNRGEGEVEALLREVDWEETGVSRLYVDAWWKAHLKRDEDRRLEEDRKHRLEALQNSAYGKLTPEEREAVGLK